jgi:hypothetical protein
MADKEQKDGCMRKTSKGCLGFLLGPALLTGAVYMLFWNEGEYINISHALDEAEPQVQRVENIAAPAPENEGKLVFMRGQASTTDVLRDETYGVEANAIVLKRSVQYAQWVEKKTKRSVSTVDIAPLMQLLETTSFADGARADLRLAAGNTMNINPNLVLQAFWQYSGIQPVSVQVLRLRVLDKDFQDFA